MNIKVYNMIRNILLILNWILKLQECYLALCILHL